MIPAAFQAEAAALVARVKADRTINDDTKLALLFLLDLRFRQAVSDLVWAQIEAGIDAEVAP